MSQAVSDNPIIVAPGELRDICGIPTAITDNHHENFYFWQKFGIRNASMLHVDAHSDMYGPAPLMSEGPNELPEDYYIYLDLATFICPAFYYGMISGIYWNDPHAHLGHRFKDLGCKHGIDSRRKLETYTEGENIFWDKDEDFHASNCDRLDIMPQKMKLEKGYLLDVDLDGFCCMKTAGGVSGYEKRIRETCGVLENFEMPGLITITKSFGDKESSRYVPGWLVDDVLRKFIREVKGVYLKKRFLL